MPLMQFNQQLFSNSHHQSVPNLLPNTSLERSTDKLKKELAVKFIKNKQKAQQNMSIKSHHKSNSFILSNRLTKSTFSLNDTMLKKVPLKDENLSLKDAVKNIKKTTKQSIYHSFRDRHQTYSNNHHHDFFQTKLQENADLQTRKSQQLIKSAKELHPQSSEQIFSNRQREKQNKFKLIFRQNGKKLKNACERKIDKLNCKIMDLKRHQRYLSTLMPVDQVIPSVKRAQPKGVIVREEKIEKLIFSLIKNIELYFNMYSTEYLVGGHLKKIEGFNPMIASVLMHDDSKAKRITNPSQIQSRFWVYSKASDRPLYFGEEDLFLYNTLNNYQMKMDKKYQEQVLIFSRFEGEKSKEQKQGLAKCIKSCTFVDKKTKKVLNEIIEFIQNKKSYDEARREEYLCSLEKRDVKLNLYERSRDLILREKERVHRKSKIHHYL